MLNVKNVYVIGGRQYVRLRCAISSNEIAISETNYPMYLFATREDGTVDFIDRQKDFIDENIDKAIYKVKIIRPCILYYNKVDDSNYEILRLVKDGICYPLGLKVSDEYKVRYLEEDKYKRQYVREKDRIYKGNLIIFSGVGNEFLVYSLKEKGLERIYKYEGNALATNILICENILQVRIVNEHNEIAEERFFSTEGYEVKRVFLPISE